MSSALARMRQDLFERRLWPIALVLVVALVAVPLLARRSAAEPAAITDQAPASVASGAVAAAARAMVAPAPSAPSGRARDPFPATSGQPAPAAASSRPQGGPSRPAASTAAVSAGSASVSGPPGAGTGSPGSGTGSGSGSSPASPPASSGAAPALVRSPKPAIPAPSRVAHRSAPRAWTIRYVDLRVGAGAPERRGVARLAPLPSGGAPLALMLGVLQDGRTVAFRIGPGVAVAGQGRCVPGRSICTQLVLRPGESADLTAPGGQPLRLELVAVRTRRTTSAARARQAYARVSPAGRCILDALAAYEYDARTGELRRAATGERCRYAAPTPGATGTLQALR